MAKASKILYTKTDERRQWRLTHSSDRKRFYKSRRCNRRIEDISLAGRILSVFPDYLTPQQKQSDDLSELGEWPRRREANIIKLADIQRLGSRKLRRALRNSKAGIPYS